MPHVHCFDPIYTPFSLKEVSEITLEPVNKCLRDRDRGLLNSSVPNADRDSKEFNMHSFVDCVEYVLKLRLWKKTNTFLLKWQSLELALDWICRSIDDAHDLDQSDLRFLEDELKSNPSEYTTVSQILCANSEFSFASLILNSWNVCSHRCHYYLLGQLSFESILHDSLGDY